MPSPFPDLVVCDAHTVRAIGTGVRGCQLLEASLLVPGVECVAVSDLYDGRHASSRKIKG
jgi:hypothetical protein